LAQQVEALSSGPVQEALGGSSSSQRQEQVLQQCTAASCVWEVAALLRLHSKWHAAAVAEDGQAAGGAADLGLVPPLAATVLQQLEQPALDLLQRHQQQAAAAGGDPEDALLPQVPAAMWHSLQLATALRHLLDPARVVREQQRRVKKQLRKVGGQAGQQQQQQRRQAQPHAQQEQEMEQEIKAEAEEEEQEEEAEVEEEPGAAAAGGAGGAPEEVAQLHGAFASLLSSPTPARQQQEQQQPQQQEQQEAQHGAFASLLAAPVGGSQQPAGNARQREAQGQDLPQGEAVQLEQWRRATERNEMLLLQRHMHAALGASVADGEGGMDVDGASPPADSGAAAAGRLSRLLMADWITLNVQDSLLLSEMLPLAARQVPAVSRPVYAAVP
jgi:hypothetical protein